MIKIIKKKINMSDELRSKINCSCKFNNRPYQIIEGHLRIVEQNNYKNAAEEIILNELIYTENV